MYTFALMVLMGLAVMKLVDLVGHFRTTPTHPATRVTIAVILGIAAAWALEFSVFGAWGYEVRNLSIGYVATGLIIGSLASALHSVVGLIDGVGRKARDEAVEIEERHLRAA